MESCAACGKTSSNLKGCKACELIKYCGRECQIAHRPKHKKACSIRAAELFDMKLFKQPPKKEDCPICCITMPLKWSDTGFMDCCGKAICLGCFVSLTRVHVCPFCNDSNVPRNDEELIKRYTERMEKFNDPMATYLLGSYYENGNRGLPVDYAKAAELYQRASELGSGEAHYFLGQLYKYGKGVEQGVQVDEKKALHHYQLAAISGVMDARYKVGEAESEKGNVARSLRHLMIAAKCGHDGSLETIKLCFTKGLVTKEDFAKALREHKASQDETKSEQRERAKALRDTLP